MNLLKLLTNAQAEAIYRAMCELNNIGCHLSDMTMPAGRERIQVRQEPSGKVRIDLVDITHEEHADQSAFATFYGLNPEAGAQMFEFDGERFTLQQILEGNAHDRGMVEFATTAAVGNEFCGCKRVA
jgi:hypothetical protein